MINRERERGGGEGGGCDVPEGFQTLDAHDKAQISQSLENQRRNIFSKTRIPQF